MYRTIQTEDNLYQSVDAGTHQKYQMVKMIRSTFVFRTFRCETRCSQTDLCTTSAWLAAAMTSLKGKLASKSSPMTSRQRDKVFSSYSYSCIQNKLNYHLINNESNTEADDKRGNDGLDKWIARILKWKTKTFLINTLYFYSSAHWCQVSTIMSK